MSVINNKGPLGGLTVLDFGHYYAGPMAAMMLADQGATVIRIVRPGLPELPEHQYRLLNRNKKLLSLDLKTAEGLATAKELAERADVVIENFRPGVMKRLGLDYASLKTANPGLVYLSLPGFASTDKERASLQAWEGVIAAAAGVFTEASMFRQRFGFDPVYSSVPQCSTYGAVQGATAVMAALMAREQYGIGTVIETPLAKAGLAGFGLDFVNDRVGDLRSQSKGDYELPDVLKPLQHTPGESEDDQWEKFSILHHKVYNAGVGTKSYPCSDGRQIYISLYLSEKFAERLLRAMGLDSQVRQEGYQILSPWVGGTDCSLIHPKLANARRERFLEILSETFLSKTADEWETILNKAGVPAAKIRTRDEWLALEPMHQSGVQAVQGEQGKQLTVPGRIGTVATKADQAAFYADAEAITEAEAKALFPEKQPMAMPTNQKPLQKGDLLKGVKILDLCNVVAGPTSARTMAEFGAEVIKAEAPNGVHPRFVPSALYLNHGKRSIVTDVKTAPGQKVYEHLVKWADLIVHNILDYTGGRMGADHQQLQAINPDVVTCQLSGFGGEKRGYWENRTCFDNLMQGACGLSAWYGTLDTPLWHGRITSADTIGGFSQAFISLVGLYQKRKTGFAGECRTSLARATNHYQLPLMIAENGKADWGEPHGQFTKGTSPWQHLYKCEGSWVYVGTTKETAAKLAELVTGVSTVDEMALAAGFARKAYAHWFKVLTEAGIAVQRCITVDDICEDGMKMVSNDAEDDKVDADYKPLMRWENHPWGLPVILLAPDSTRVGEDQTFKRLRPAPRYGEHTAEILSELGYADAEIEELIRLNVSHEYLPVMGDKNTYFVKDNSFTGYGGKK